MLQNKFVKKLKHPTAFTISPVAFALAACGGGGDQSEGAAQAQNTDNSPVDIGQLQYFDIVGNLQKNSTLTISIPSDDAQNLNLQWFRDGEQFLDGIKSYKLTENDVGALISVAAIGQDGEELVKVEAQKKIADVVEYGGYFVSIDYRYDTSASPGVINPNSFEFTSPYIDLAESNGFEGVTFLTNVPINISDGVVQTLIENPTEGIGSTQDRSYPDDMWKVIDYAEAMGLQTRIDLLPVNHIADTAVFTSSETSSSSRLSEDTDYNSLFFQITEYKSQIAKLAEAHGVEAINIAAYGMYTDELFPFWEDLISELREIYSGQIGITVGIGQSPAILGLVDFCYVDIGANVIDYFPDDFSQLKSSYLAPENRARSPVEYVRRIDSEFQVDVILSTRVPAVSSEPGVALPWRPWEGDEIPDWATPFVEENVFPDYQNQKKELAAIIEASSEYLGGIVDGIRVTELQPWADAPHYVQENANQSYVVLHKTSVSLNPTWNPEILDFLTNYTFDEFGATPVTNGEILL